jgi:hypothetical protein
MTQITALVNSLLKPGRAARLTPHLVDVMQVSAPVHLLDVTQGSAPAHLLDVMQVSAPAHLLDVTQGDVSAVRYCVRLR